MLSRSYPEGVLNYVCIFLTGVEGHLHVVLGEISSASRATINDLKKHCSYFSFDKKNHVFGEEDLDRSITVISADSIGTDSGDRLHTVLSLDMFLPFMSEPGFRQQLAKKDSLNIYASMAFWMFDPEYAAIFVHNISNKRITEVKKEYGIKNLDDTFVKMNFLPETAEAPERYTPETYITLKTIFDRGDLSFAPDPSVCTYKHLSEDLDLNLAVINHMLVRELKMPEEMLQKYYD